MNDIKQLILNSSKKRIDPSTSLDAVYDQNTIKTLREILQGFNTLHLIYSNSAEETRLKVPQEMRRAGLQISYEIPTGDSYTFVMERYMGKSVDDTAFSNTDNWNEQSDMDKYISDLGQFTRFSEKSDYAVDTVVQKGSYLFKFIEAHSAGAWNFSHVKPYSVIDYIQDINTQLQNQKEIIESTVKYKTVLISDVSYAALTKYDDKSLYFVYDTSDKTKVAKPVNQVFTYDGYLHVLESTKEYTVTGNGGTIVGDYKFTVTLNDGYMWDDGTDDVLTITYTIMETNPGTWYFGSVFPMVFA